VGNVPAGRHLGRAQPVKRPEHRRFSGALGFAVVQQIDDHRDPERVREQDELLPLREWPPLGVIGRMAAALAVSAVLCYGTVAILAIVMASNIGSTATITGNPQNILTGFK
jgi:hypothetical protein